MDFPSSDIFRKALKSVSDSMWDTDSDHPKDFDIGAINAKLEDSLKSIGNDIAVQDKQVVWDNFDMPDWESSTKSWFDDWWKTSTEPSWRSDEDDFRMKQISDMLMEGLDGFGSNTALSDFPDEDNTNVPITVRVYKTLMMPSDDSLAMWRCAGVATGLVLATLAVLSLLWLMFRCCCCRKPHVTTCVPNGELGTSGANYLPPAQWSDKQFYPPAVGWNDKQSGVQLIEPRLLDLYTKPSADEVDPRHIDMV